MGGFFGVTSRRNCILDVFFGTDYHSHLGTRRGGMAAYDPKIGLQREIHNIENSPFRTKFEHILDEMSGNAAIGCISDSDPQPLLIRSNLGTYAISTMIVCIMCPTMSLIATLLFKEPSFGTWVHTFGCNMPMALIWQLLYCGPLCRLLFRLLFRVSAAQPAETH